MNQNIEEDVTFVLKKLFKLSKNKQDDIIMHYIKLWKQTAHEEPINHKKQNKGRYAANIWLLNQT